jgi:hypothetical protein
MLQRRYQGWAALGRLRPLEKRRGTVFPPCFGLEMPLPPKDQLRVMKNGLCSPSGLATVGFIDGRRRHCGNHALQQVPPPEVCAGPRLALRVFIDEPVPARKHRGVPRQTGRTPPDTVQNEMNRHLQ